MAIETRNRLIGFRSRKAAQAAAYFAAQSRSKIDKMKLIKLLYLIERESIEKRGRPMLFDEFYSMKDGPICSDALNGLNGLLDKPIWDKYVKRTDHKMIRLARNIDDSDLDEISKSDLGIMKDVWDRFGHMTSPQIRKWTHENCEEYKRVVKGRLPISYRDIYAALHYEHPDKMEDTVREHRSLEAVLGV